MRMLCPLLLTVLLTGMTACTSTQATTLPRSPTAVSASTASVQIDRLPTTIPATPNSSFVYYRGPNPYRESPAFEVEYDSAVWLFAEDDGSSRKAQLFQRDIPGCTMWLQAGPVGDQLLSTRILAGREWTISLIQPAILNYATPLKDIYFIIGVILPEKYLATVESPCQQAAEDVLQTFKVIELPTTPTSLSTRTTTPRTGGTSTPTVPVISLAGATGYIVFSRVSDLYRMAPDGSHLMQMTQDSGINLSPACSFNGKKIAFISDRAGPAVHWQIYVMNADGSGQARITNSSAMDIAPAWSPDGKKIAFASTREGRSKLFVMNADGSNQTRLLDSPEEVNSVAWSPDGTKLAFGANYALSAYSHIFAVKVDGSGLIDLTPEIDFAFSPAWSPDGTRIAFSAGFRNSNEIYVMNKDGSHLTRLTTTPDRKSPWDKYQPTWSPDGKWILYYSNAYNSDLGNGNYQLWIMKADGTTQTRLTHEGVNDNPCWLATTQSLTRTKPEFRGWVNPQP